MKRFSIFLFFLIATCVLNAQDSYRNYVLTRTILDTSGKYYLDNITYYDGLGRPFQTVQKAVQNGLPVNKNLATLQEYDAAGREWNSWLPLAAGSSDYLSPASFKSSAPGNYDNDSRAYSQPVYKASPLRRLTAQYGPGTAWYNAGRSVKTEYLLNTNAAPLNCIKYGVSSSDALTGNPTTFYAVGELSVVKTTNEDQNVSYSFTDKQGRTVLTRQMNGNEGHDTYYIYNDKGNLCFVLQPQYQESADLSKYAFQYEYDNRNRCTKKTIPGAAFVEYTYNDADQLTFSQDGNQRTQTTKKWTYYLYDKFGRLTEQGECTNKSATSSPVAHIHNYYDGYGFIGKNGFSPTYYTAGDANGKGYLTGSIVAVTGGNQKIYTSYYYDIYGHEVKCVYNKPHGGFTAVSTTYTFTGQPSTVSYNQLSGPEPNEVYTYTYDWAERLSEVKHSLNNNTVTLAKYEYNNKGQLISKSFHGSTGNQLTYTYNLRSWMESIEGTYFTEKLHYTNGNAPVKYYGGNISSMEWQVHGESSFRNYLYNYDGLGRLGTATYTDGTSKNFTEQITSYDKNGNIGGLKRYGQTGAGTYGLIDDLKFSWTGNRPDRVDDASTATVYNGGFEFKDGKKQAGEYAYDANGNLIKDLNKGIDFIGYNFLSLPDSIHFQNGSTINYQYAADGTKLRTVHRIAGSAEFKREYCGNVVYENNVQKYLLTGEGYVDLTDNNRYHYYLQDHQGNNRVVTAWNAAEKKWEVKEVTHYYPFGGTFANNTSVQSYKYNGKELDTKNGLNWYDYGAREYDAALGMFTTLDPSSEKYYSTSPYAYCGGDPVNRIDPTGADWYKDSDGNYHWAERGGNITEGWTWVGSSVSIEISKNRYVNYYENGGIVANKPVNAFDLIASSPRLQNLFLGENSLLSEASKSRLFNGLINRSLNSIGIPIGQALVNYGAAEFGGVALGKIFGWGAKSLAKLTGKGNVEVATSMQVSSVQSTTIGGVKRHGVHQMITRGFKASDVLKIVKEGNPAEAMGRYGAQIRYSLNGNTVVLNAKREIVSVFSNMPGTKNGIGMGYINPFE